MFDVDVVIEGPVSEQTDKFVLFGEDLHAVVFRLEGGLLVLQRTAFVAGKTVTIELPCGCKHRVLRRIESNLFHTFEKIDLAETKIDEFFDRTRGHPYGTGLIPMGGILLKNC